MGADLDSAPLPEDSRADGIDHDPLGNANPDSTV